jgi:hypothetical protein
MFVMFGLLFCSSRLAHSIPVFPDGRIRRRETLKTPPITERTDITDQN